MSFATQLFAAAEEQSANVSWAPWLQSYRATKWQALQHHGLPTHKHEQWRYTNLTILHDKIFASPLAATIDPLVIKHHRLVDAIHITCVNGFFDQALSDLTQLPEGVIICSLRYAQENHPQLLQQYWSFELDVECDPFASLAAATFVDGVFCYIPPHCQITKPLHFLWLAQSAQSFMAQPLILVVAGENSVATIFEEHIALTSPAYFMNSITQVTLEQHAQLQWYKLQNHPAQSVHLAYSLVKQHAQSESKFLQVAIGGAFARDDIKINLTAPLATTKTCGYYHLRYDKQYIDYHLQINHQAPSCQSAMLYKGVLNQQSRAVFNGSLLVCPDAQKTIAYQANHNVLLSKLAEVYSKPELEIYADDVKCKHGATIGELDQAALFYLRARGIDEATALKLLHQGFMAEVLDEITHAEIKKHIERVVNA